MPGKRERGADEQGPAKKKPKKSETIKPSAETKQPSGNVEKSKKSQKQHESPKASGKGAPALAGSVPSTKKQKQKREQTDKVTADSRQTRPSDSESLHGKKQKQASTTKKTALQASKKLLKAGPAKDAREVLQKPTFTARPSHARSAAKPPLAEVFSQGWTKAEIQDTDVIPTRLTKTEVMEAAQTPTLQPAADSEAASNCDPPLLAPLLYSLDRQIEMDSRRYIQSFMDHHRPVPKANRAHNQGIVGTRFADSNTPTIAQAMTQVKKESGELSDPVRLLDDMLHRVRDSAAKRPTAVTKTNISRQNRAVIHGESTPGEFEDRPAQERYSGQLLNDLMGFKEKGVVKTAAEERRIWLDSLRGDGKQDPAHVEAVLAKMDAREAEEKDILERHRNNRALPKIFMGEQFMGVISVETPSAAEVILFQQRLTAQTRTRRFMGNNINLGLNMSKRDQSWYRNPPVRACTLRTPGDIKHERLLLEYETSVHGLMEADRRSKVRAKARTKKIAALGTGKEVEEDVADGCPSNSAPQRLALHDDYDGLIGAAREELRARWEQGRLPDADAQLFSHSLRFQ